MSNYKSTWTPAQDAMLIRLWCQGELSCSGIAARIHSEFKINVTRNSVIGRAHRLSLSRDQPPEAKVVARRMPSKPRISVKTVLSETHEFYTELAERLTGECQFILNDSSPFQFCHAPSSGPWCPKHKKVVTRSIGENPDQIKWNGWRRG